MVYSCNFSIILFYFSFDRVPNEIEDSQRFLPRFPTPSALYDILGGIGYALAGGVVDGVAFALVDGVGVGDRGWQVRGVRG